MHLIDEQGQEFEGQIVTPDRVLIRGEIGGLRPQLVHPDALLERARCLTERRQTTRRLGPPERRSKPRTDRRGATALWIPACGRRRADAMTWDDDRATALANLRLAAWRRRVSGETPAA